MEVNIIFDNVKAYDVTKIDVLLGQSFAAEVVSFTNPVRWFSDNDPVLDLRVSPDGLSSQITATQKGITEIQLQSGGGLVKTLFIEVYDRVSTNLGLTAGAPELKG